MTTTATTTTTTMTTATATTKTNVFQRERWITFFQGLFCYVLPKQNKTEQNRTQREAFRKISKEQKGGDSKFSIKLDICCPRGEKWFFLNSAALSSLIPLFRAKQQDGFGSRFRTFVCRICSSGFFLFFLTDRCFLDAIWIKSSLSFGQLDFDDLKSSTFFSFFTYRYFSKQMSFCR